MWVETFVNRGIDTLLFMLNQRHGFKSYFASVKLNHRVNFHSLDNVLLAMRKRSG
jgi:hypothetical protein